MIASRQIAFGRSAKKGLSAKDYVQDGLVVMWDGIENAGWGRHSNTSTMWTDLINRKRIPLCSSASWKENCVDITVENPSDSNSFGAGKSSMIMPLSEEGDLYKYWENSSAYTLEVLFYDNGICNPATTMVYCFAKEGSFEYFYKYGNIKSCLAHIPNGGGHIIQNIYPNGAGVKQTSIIFDVMEDEVNENGNPRTIANCYTEGVLKRERSAFTGRGTKMFAENDKNTNHRLALNGSAYWNKSGMTHIQFHSIRIYNRALTADEIAHNYEIDKARFGL